MKIQAREIIRAAKRLGIQIRRGNGHYCAMGVVNQSRGFSYYDSHCIPALADNLNMSPADIAAVEVGFEGWVAENYSYDHLDISKADVEKSRYLKVGQNVAKLAGLA